MRARNQVVAFGGLLFALLAGCAADDEQVREDGALRRPGPVAETHAIIEGSRDPIMARSGALLSLRCLAFDDEGFVTSSMGLRPTLRSGIGLAKVRAEGWLELLAAGRLEVACDHPDAVVRTTVVMIDPLTLEQAAFAPPRPR